MTSVFKFEKCVLCMTHYIDGNGKIRSYKIIRADYGQLFSFKFSFSLIGTLRYMNANGGYG